MKASQFSPVVLVFVVLFAFSCNADATQESAATTDTAAATTTAPGAANTNEPTTEANKKLVTDFIQSLYGDKDSAAIDRYVADNLKTHNPLLQDGKETLKNSLRPFLENKNIEKVKIDIRQIIAEGDKVWVLIREVAPNGKVFARVDIFRIENGKIAENWLVSQAEAKESANTNGMF